MKGMEESLQGVEANSEVVVELHLDKWVKSNQEDKRESTSPALRRNCRRGAHEGMWFILEEGSLCGQSVGIVEEERGIDRLGQDYEGPGIHANGLGFELQKLGPGGIVKA